MCMKQYQCLPSKLSNFIQKYVSVLKKTTLEMTKLIIFLFCGMLCASGCDNNSLVSKEAVEEDEIAYILTQPNQGDVYVAGAIDGKAVLWKNGDVQYLSDGTFDEAKSVYISGNHVYIAGNVDKKAMLWKNGVVQKLSDDGGANSVFISGNDVYVAGFETNKRGYSAATVWKNGKAQKLSDETLDAYAVAKSVYVSDGDVYVVGDVRSEKDYYTEDCFGVAWKNGVAQNFFDENKSVKLNSVFISSDDVYVAGVGRGTVGYAAIVWVNGIAQHLEGGGSIYSDAEASSIFVSGSDVYVAGSFHGRTFHYGKLWKNGEDIYSSTETSIYSVYVTGDDVYKVGSAIPRSAFLWKNDEIKLLSQGNNAFASTRAFSVFVVE